MMPDIQRITTKVVSLELKGSLRWGKYGQLDALEHVLVSVTLSDGSVGYAEAPARPSIYGETAVTIRHVIEDYLAPKVCGLSADDEAVYDLLHSLKNNHCAKAALDMALWDARAKARGSSLKTELLGPNRKLRVSYILGISDIDVMLREAQQVFAQGVSVFKIKIGRDSAHDSEIIESLNSVFADEDVILYADANEMLRPENAHARLEHLASLGIAYVEEPLPIHLLRERVALRQAAILPIIADDSCFSLAELRRELAFDSFDILNIKTARTGFRDSLQMLELARRHHKEVMLGSQASAGLGSFTCALVASQAGVNLPSELSFPLKLKEDILQTAFVFEGGYLDVGALEPQLKPPHADVM